ncbi:MAG: formylglycine-generating enzyme family protein [Thiothrix sp.]|uniref:formylglycine-generating enzyme family protein n=1 Tax=Thiothrix sp. TaxID=1032 RepID=UPI002602A6F2|nr:formylglycine-generating enzyme family protein [Thiothrix sp.]MDD5395255.1 formylglycine-generating enzyme family protein [Thiothrix sp.]
MTYRNYLSPPVFPYAWASDWGEDQYGLWMAFTYYDVRHAFRWIEPGTFMMGSPETEKGRLDWEIQHQVTLSKGFWMAETPVTQALWQVVMGENPSNFKGEKRPVEQVSWNDAQAFITKLNQVHPDLNVCLPTEAQWEYACRAGTQTPFNFGDELTLDKVNYRGTWEWEGLDKWGDGAKQQTTDVTSYPSNAWGLYDMHGNVWEWCQDVWQEKLPASPVTDPEGIAGGDQEAGVERVVRGGSWAYDGGGCRSAYRDRDGPDGRNDGSGFRLILGH